jgi:hypothetical protein
MVHSAISGMNTSLLTKCVRLLNAFRHNRKNLSFSIDIAPVILAQILAYTFLLLAIFVCGIELKTRHLYHVTYKLFTFSKQVTNVTSFCIYLSKLFVQGAMLNWSGVLLNSVTWAKYALTGIGPFSIFGGLFIGKFQ